MRLRNTTNFVSTRILSVRHNPTNVRKLNRSCNCFGSWGFDRWDYLASLRRRRSSPRVAEGVWPFALFGQATNLIRAVRSAIESRPAGCVYMSPEDRFWPSSQRSPRPDQRCVVQSMTPFKPSSATQADLVRPWFGFAGSFQGFHLYLRGRDDMFGLREFGG